jgi:hypothetical protein
MKSALALALVFLSTLAVASHGMVHQRHCTHTHSHTHSHTHTTNNTNTNTNTNTGTNTNTNTGTNTNTNTGTNTNTNTNTNTGTGTGTSTTTSHSSDGYVQNPSGNASFTMYNGCGTPCKLCAYFPGLVVHGVRADRDDLLQRAA